MFNKFKLKSQTTLFIPYLIFIIIFVFVPLVFVLIGSFIIPEGAVPNYDKFEMWKDKSFWFIFFKSILIGIVTAFICLFISLPYVYIIINTKTKSTKMILLSLIISPLILFTLVKVLAIKGLLTLIFDVPLEHSAYIVLGLVYLNLPFMIIPLYTVLKGMPINIIQASQDLGYTKLMTFIKVVIPYGLKAICSGLTVVFLLSIMSVAVSNKLLDNAAGNQLLGNIIDNLANPSNPFDMQKASSVVFVTLIGISIVYSLFNSIPWIYRRIKGGTND